MDKYVNNDVDSDETQTKDEIVALENIYSDEEFSYQRHENTCYHCIFNISVTLPKVYHIIVNNLTQPKQEPEKIEISHLPPLTLEVTLPDDYPRNSPPNLKLRTCWLSQEALSKLCRKLDNLWDENKGDQILYTWADFLKQETVSFLNIEESLKIDHVEEQSMEEVKLKNESNGEGKNSAARNSEQIRYDTRAVCDCPHGKSLVQLLIDYDKKCDETEFKKNFYNCKICFTETLGENCIQFSPCTHIFCKDCISNYLQIKIKDGCVKNLCCPEEKCTSEITPGQIKSLISSDFFNKYDSLLLNVTLDTMPDIIYCPRINCHYPVIREQNGLRELAQCPNCQLAFCIFCKAVYHGIEPCKINSAEKQKLVSEYQKATDERKLELEKRYGKKNLQDLVESTMSEDWIHSNTNNCPQCNAPIEKSEGCNKMTCWKCNTYFCWLCRKVLNSQTPYLHYDDPNSKCYGLLTHRILNYDDDDDDDDGVDDNDAGADNDRFEYNGHQQELNFITNLVDVFEFPWLL